MFVKDISASKCCCNPNVSWWVNCTTPGWRYFASKLRVACKPLLGQYTTIWLKLQKVVAKQVCQCAEHQDDALCICNVFLNGDLVGMNASVKID